MCESQGSLISVCENCQLVCKQDPSVLKSFHSPLCSCSSPGELLCYCSRHLPPLCYTCLELHRTELPNELHVTLPLFYKDKVSDRSFLQRLVQKQQRLESRKAEMRINLQRLEACEEEFTKKCEQLMAKIQQYRSAILESLLQAKDTLSQMMSNAIREAEYHLCEESYSSEHSLTAALLSETCLPLAKRLFTYHLRFDPEAVSIALQLNFDLATPQTAPLQIPWITNKSLRLFDTSTQTWGPLWTFSKIFADDHSCVLSLPDDSFLVSGNSSARTQVLRLRPSDHSITPFACFETGRVGHGMLIWRGLACAFGGYDLRSCEQIALSEPQAWSVLGNMHYCRRFFNPCTYDSLAYLCGGEGINTVEIFDYMSHHFTVLPFTLPCASNSLTAVWQGTLFIFQEDYVTTWVLGSSSPEVTRKRLVNSR